VSWFQIGKDEILSVKLINIIGASIIEVYVVFEFQYENKKCHLCMQEAWREVRR